MSGTYVFGDWGTTRLRLYRMRDDEVLDRLEGPGIGSLNAPAIHVLTTQLEGWRGEGDIDALFLCGMAGVRGGLVEAAYLGCPATILAWGAAHSRIMVDGIRVAVAPGLSCHTASGAPDVMRGEETQIFGAMTINPALAKGEHLFLLPGTHSKWARVKDGAVTGFRTCPTGELFALLTTQSTLTGPDSAGQGGFDEGFTLGFSRRAEPLANALFEARAGRLLHGWSRPWARGYLSGLLIGSEVHAQGVVGEQIIVIGDPALSGLYLRALSADGLGYLPIDGEKAALAGLELARREVE